MRLKLREKIGLGMILVPFSFAVIAVLIKMLFNADGRFVLGMVSYVILICYLLRN